MKYELRQINCPSGCGWRRQYSTDTDLKFDHPMWGERTSKELAELDERTHQCLEYRAAKKRVATLRTTSWWRYGSVNAASVSGGLYPVSRRETEAQ